MPIGDGQAGSWLGLMIVKTFVIVICAALATVVVLLVMFCVLIVVIVVKIAVVFRLIGVLVVVGADFLQLSSVMSAAKRPISLITLYY